MNRANKQEIKTALVTGGARRVGAAIVRMLHAAGFKVVIHCRNSLDEAHALAQDLNRLRIDSAFVLQRDLLLENVAEELINTIIDWSGRLDLLVNNASIFTRSDLSQEGNKNLAEWDDLFNTNVKVPYQLSLAARSFLMKTNGAIINLTDIHAQRPLKGYVVYCQTKAAFEMQTKALAKAFAPEIRVNAVAPGAIAWPEETNSLSYEQQQQIIAKTPLKKHGSPECIAQAVLALAENEFITGQILNVDGGRSI